MFIGDFRLGDWVPFSLKTGDTVPSWPTDASGNRVFPKISIFDANGDYVTRDELMAPIATETGLHILNRALGPEFSAGRYTVLYQWQIGSNTVNRQDASSFNIVAGGDSRGAIVGIHSYRTPRGTFVVTQSDSGTLEKRRGPKL